MTIETLSYNFYYDQRNEAFASRYNYNVNQQNFVERQPKEGCRFLHTVGVDIAAFSLKRHGMDLIQVIKKRAFKSLEKVGCCRDLINLCKYTFPPLTKFLIFFQVLL